MKRFFLTAIIILATAGTAVSQQRVKFNPDYSIKDWRVELGVYAGLEGNTWTGASFSAIYTRQFWNHFAYRAGVQYVSDAPGFDGMVGVPLGIVYRPGTMSVGQSLGLAVERSVTDIVYDGWYGRTDRIGSDILMNFVLALFRRTEYFVGVTPSWFNGPFDELNEYQGDNRFVCTGDAGFVLSIPIWRITLNLTPAYHYSFTKNIYYNDLPSRHFFSLSFGLGYLF